MKKIFATLLLLVSMLAVTPVVAATALGDKCDSGINFTPSINVPGTSIIAGQEIEICNDTLGNYVVQIYKAGIYIAGIVATITIMAGGFVWVMAGGNTSRVDQAKTMIKGAVLGYVLLLLSWVLLNTINPALVNFRSLDIFPVGNIPIDDSNRLACCYFPLDQNEGLISKSECEYVNFIAIGTCNCGGQKSVVNGAKECIDLGNEKGVECAYEEGNEGKQLAEAKKVCDTAPVFNDVFGLNSQVFIGDCQQVAQCKDILLSTGRMGQCSIDNAGQGCGEGAVCNQAWLCNEPETSGVVRGRAGENIEVKDALFWSEPNCCKPYGVEGDVCLSDGECANGYTCYGADDPWDFHIPWSFGTDTLTLGECRKL